MVLVILSGSDMLAREVNFDDCIIRPNGHGYQVVDPGCGAVVAQSDSYPVLARWLYKSIH